MGSMGLLSNHVKAKKSIQLEVTTPTIKLFKLRISRHEVMAHQNECIRTIRRLDRLDRNKGKRSILHEQTIASLVLW